MLSSYNITLLDSLSEILVNKYFRHIILYLLQYLFIFNTKFIWFIHIYVFVLAGLWTAVCELARPQPQSLVNLRLYCLTFRYNTGRVILPKKR